jgi:hypothetical protein
MDFAFNASALGAGGVIERGDVITTIPSIASVALAPTGGEGRSVVTNYFSEELEFSHAETRVFGRQHTGADGKALFTTSTYVLLKDVAIFSTLRIAEMHSTVTSTRGFTGGEDHDFEILVSFRGVRIGRVDIDPRVDERLTKLRRYKELEGMVTAGRAARPEDHALAQRFGASPDQFVKLVGEKKPLQGSLVESIDGLEAKAPSPIVTIPGIGTVRFAELMIKPGRRRLNLLRIKFGPARDGGRFEPQGEGEMPQALMMMAPAPMGEEAVAFGPSGGSMTLGSGEGNGTPIEP